VQHRLDEVAFEREYCQVRVRYACPCGATVDVVEPLAPYTYVAGQGATHEGPECPAVTEKCFALALRLAAL
jgi:hypothetical protein